MKKSLVILLILIAFILSGATAMAKTGDTDCQQMLINNEHALPAKYEPESVTYLTQFMRARDTVALTKEAANAAAAMIADMQAVGLTDIYGQSGYRSFYLQDSLNQKKIYSYYALGYETDEAKTLADQVVASPGTSEHQSGLAIDFSTWSNGKILDESFADTPVGKWLEENSWKYGFVLRYPKDKTALTEYTYEPWHYRYVGVLTAEILHKNNLCLDEYFSLLEKENILTYTAINGNSYAIYLSQGSSNIELAGKVISISQAYADSTEDFIIIAKMQDTKSFDRVSNWSTDNLSNLTNTDILDGAPGMTYKAKQHISRAELIALLARAYSLLQPNGSKQSMDEQHLSYIRQVLTNGQSIYQRVPVDPNASLSPDTVFSADLGLEEISKEYLWDKPTLGSGQEGLRQEAVQLVTQLSLEMENISQSALSINDLAEDDASVLASVALLADAGIIPKGSLNQTMVADSPTYAQLRTILDDIAILLEEELDHYLG